ncbi:MAG: hypothetical protein WA632_04320 [Gallionella sp.]
MQKFPKLVAIFSIVLTHLAIAAEPAVEISAPADGAKLSAMRQHIVEYNVTKGNGGDHIHLYVDGDEAALLRQTKGSYAIEYLAPGNHEICIKLVNKNHTPIGVQRCIKVAVEK